MIVIGSLHDCLRKTFEAALFFLKFKKNPITAKNEGDNDKSPLRSLPKRVCSDNSKVVLCEVRDALKPCSRKKKKEKTTTIKQSRALQR